MYLIRSKSSFLKRSKYWSRSQKAWTTFYYRATVFNNKSAAEVVAKALRDKYKDSEIKVKKVA